MVLAVQTPHRESEGQRKASGGGSALDDIDVAWLTEHAKQVGVFLFYLYFFIVLTRDMTIRHDNIPPMIKCLFVCLCMCLCD